MTETAKKDDKTDTKAKNAEDEKPEAEQPKQDLSKIPIRAYLDQTVVPILLQGMASLVKQRPEDPVMFLAQYLIKNNPQQKKAE